MSKKNGSCTGSYSVENFRKPASVTFTVATADIIIERAGSDNPIYNKIMCQDAAHHPHVAKDQVKKRLSSIYNNN